MYWFRLALAFGTPVRELQEKMSSIEFAEWIAYSNIEPIGDKRGDYQAAAIAAEIHNSIAGAFGGKRVSIDDRLLNFSGNEPQQKRQQTPEEMLAVLESVMCQKSRKNKPCQ
ncbi:DUF4035 domain-containing protein [Candidatus Pacearchaeota archaeon]|jgi:hypothetical protein|nr:DUF4035 domain-containing protein [Candidatus Pacearchaeota archaeon]